MHSEQIETSISRSLRMQLFGALAVVTALAGGFGGVAAYAEISGAVIGSGTIIVAGRAKEVQHAEGGIIGTISVREGERVEAGKTLFQLDGTAVRANLGIVESQLKQLLAQEARLLTEQGRLDAISFPEELAGEEADVSLLRRGQIELMNARRATLIGRKAQVDEQARQFEEKIAALTAEQEAVNENISLLDEQLVDVSYLNKRGLLVDSQLIAVKRERASLMGKLASLKAEVVEAKQAISERKIQKAQIDEEFLEQVLTELDQKRVEIARLRQEKVAALDRLERIDIRSPMAGYVHQLAVHTVGRVITPGETLLQIIPDDDDLLIEAKLNPTDIDSVHRGQIARVRMTGLDQRITPQLTTSVLSVSPDLTMDPKTGMSYYTARLALAEGELAKLERQELRPGMPVEVFVETNMRTVLSYLAKPLQDQIAHAMREN
ncbi:HlyD family type I secretion periplasmic adaptor subunit [Agaricicola taiwanensis]|uniref:Membrane fusion protein (MFP) family protein n=1 Tax=Agaricicola taiwanensis TaxID=591372 RepID=A0A8J2VNW4_9RHOB|nr:HlyD family type I secretion periplasmic adaptor subunit [Agaricicola taiwanensis]GGE31797.1 HlyD family type I secretion periplasmic adaptor subunit [Agaricicola taiwanensis]